MSLIRGYSDIFRPLHPEKYVGKGEIVYRSLWEKHVMKTLDENPNVLQWSSENIVIEYVSPVDNRRHRYFPDMWAKLKSKDGTIKTLLIEVKPLKQTRKPEGKRRTKRYLIEEATYLINQAKWAAAREYCKKRGWEFVVMTEKSIFKSTSKKN